ncbi:phytochrome-like protein cph2 [Oxobacter pfennigii]|uniref:Phytochrome-like protein cph2 n=1 Tax=Oxobacter pfennigii TaxID=36849 RepID=A0A0P8W7K3_9CLOT|nr:EAL domain-containing protein [Oxobacter pfennigii]KPU44637.1 phytochrome-like protein cph2 [Oxobacter pfennigii]
MEYAPLLFSLLFFTAFAIYLFFGIYIIHLNPKASLNKLFLIVCISLCLWSFGFSIANSAPDLKTCLFWRRISALGWSSIYSILLHFLLVLTGKTSVLKRGWFCLMLYFPALINLYVFSLSDNMAALQYSLIKLDYGWINVAVNNGWDLFFYFYYGGYTLACLGLVFIWQRKATDKNIRMQAMLICISLFAALLLGSLTDVVLSSNLTNPLPQMAPVFTLIPIMAIYYSIKRYGLMHREMLDQDELILNDEMRAILFQYLSAGYFAAGLLGFLSEYLPHRLQGTGNIYSALLTGGLLFGTGFAFQIIQRLKNENIKNTLNMIVLLSSIPLITLRFLQYTGITVWVFPIILMIISLIFNKRSLLLSITAVAIATQILIWICKPKAMVQVDGFHYLLRIGLFVMALWIGLYVNKIYVSKLKENACQIGFQKIISEISFDFVSVNQTNFEAKTNHLLDAIGRFFQVDRTYIFLFNHEDNTMTYTYEWCTQGIEPEIGTIRDVPLSLFPWWTEQLKSNKPVCVEDVSKLKAEAGAEKKQFEKVKSLVAIPIEGNGNIQGFLGIDSIVSPRKWSEDEIKLLKILANLLADGFIKVKAEKKIEFMAYYDHLTGLPNRTLFEDRLTQAIHLAKRSGKFVGVMFMDLDNFKTVNDTMGHNGGDKLIQEVAQSLAQRLRKTDTVARFGGDEFLILINSIPDSKDIARITDKLMGLFERPFNIGGQEFFITGSAGVATYPVDGEDPETLIKNADISMYKAKSKGKNQYVLCTENMKDEVQQNMMLSNSLYHAKERNELVIFYQPQIKLYTGQITGVEALLRWNHPQLGMISPGIFIPLAEKNGLINIIGEWVLKTASNQNKKWQDMGMPHLRMAVNLSAAQFKNPHLVDNVNRILKETGLSPEYLELEITESIAINEANYIIDTLDKLKNLGVSISIDDFGTEYSSLSRLKMLPLDRIKIDMQFVQGIEGNEKDQAITKIIINLAKSLELEVLAEGVETALQSEFLNGKMCDEVQGYYYYKPMPAEEFEILLKSGANKRVEY